jgi:hypothetical protein
MRGKIIRNVGAREKPLKRRYPGEVDPGKATPEEVGKINYLAEI